MRTGGVEPPQPEATGLQPAELAGAQRPRGRGDRPGSNRYREDHDLECCRYTTATTSGDDRTRTGDLSPDKRVLWPLSYAPEQLRGWDSNPRLELMRLARKAAPPPRVVKWAWVDRGLAGWSRTSVLRFPKPAG